MSSDSRALTSRRSGLDRALGVFADVRAGEAGTALLMAAYVFLLLSAYYVVKPVREALILSSGNELLSGAQLKSYAAVGQALLLSVLVPLYSAAVARLPRRLLIPLVTGGFLAMLLLFYVAARVEPPHLGIAFFLFVGVFNLMIVAQFWALANDIYTTEQGERLFPVVAVGASIGAVAGSQLTSWLIRPLGVPQLLLVSAGLLLVSIGLNFWVEKRVAGRESPDSVTPAPQKEVAQAVPAQSAFSLVAKSPYLLLIGGLMFMSNLVNTNGEFIMGRLVESFAEATGAENGLGVKGTIAKFYADFLGVVSAAGLIMQLFFVSRIVRWVGVRGAILALPLIAMGSYLAIALIPVLGVVRWLKIAENSTDYSLNNTVRNALFLPLSSEEKFKAKQATDTLFVRGGDVASAGVVALGASLGWQTAGFAWFNVVAVALWLLFAVLIGQRYRRLSSSGLASQAAAGK